MTKSSVMAATRCVRAAIALTALCVAASASARASLPQGSCSARGQVRIITLRGSVDAGGLSGSFIMRLDTRSGRYKIEHDYGAYADADGFDGQLEWTQDRSGASHAQDSGPARAIAASKAWLRVHGWCDGIRGRAAAEQQADDAGVGLPMAVWRVIPRGGVPVLLRFERSTGLLKQSEIRLWGGRLIRHYEDWRAVGGGAMIAFAVRDEYPEDESVETIKVLDVEPSTLPAPQALFAMPPPPRDYEIEGGAIAATVPYEDDGVGRIYVPAFIDGQGPFPFEVDTGGHFILTDATASALHLQPVGNANVTGGGTGVAHEGSVRTQQLRIGAALLHGQSARVIQFSSAANDRGARAPRAGFLGLELFERFAVGLDRKAKTVTLTPLEHFRRPTRGVVLPLRFTEDAPLASGSFDGVQGDFEIDSGDAGPAIIEGYWAQLQGLTDRLARGLVWSGGGVGGDYQETLTRGDLTLGPIALPHEVVSYVGLVARGSESTRLQAGVIGESSLYRFDMAYDYRRKELWIEPRTSIPARPFNRAGLRLRRNTPDSFLVVLVAAGSAAEAAGVLPGDQLLSINDRAASELGTADALALFAGAVGDELRLLLVPKGGGAQRTVKIQLNELLP